MNHQSQKIRSMVEMALFMAIILLMAFTPIGFIDLPFIKATIIHIPVIIGSILLGPKKGAFLGGLFGLTSLIVNTMRPSLLSFAFSPAIPLPTEGQGSFLSLIICFIPRILVGVVPYFIFILLQKLFKKRSNCEYISLAVAGFLGSMTNTLLVMNLIYVFFKDSLAMAKEVAVDVVYGVVLTVIGTSGVPEAIAAVVFTVAIGKILLQLQRKSKQE